MRISKRLKVVEESLSSVEGTCKLLPEDYSSTQRIDALEARLDARCEAQETALRRFEEPFAEVVGWCTRQKRDHLDKCVLINDELASLKERATSLEAAHEALKAELDQRFDAVNARINREKAELLSDLAAQDERLSTHTRQMRADLEAADLETRDFACAESRRAVCHAFGIDDAESNADTEEAEPEAEAEAEGPKDAVLDAKAEEAEGPKEVVLEAKAEEGETSLASLSPASANLGDASPRNSPESARGSPREEAGRRRSGGQYGTQAPRSTKLANTPPENATLNFLASKTCCKSFTRAQRRMLEVVSEEILHPAIACLQRDLDHHKEGTRDIAYNSSQTHSILRRQMNNVEKNVQEVQRLARELWKEIEQCTRKTETNILEGVLQGTIRELTRSYESEHFKVLAKFQEMVDHFAKVHQVMNDHEHLLRHHAEELENRCNKYCALLLQTQIDRCTNAAEKLETGVDKLRKDADGLRARVDSIKSVVKATLKRKGVSAMGRASRNSTTGSSATGFSDDDMSHLSRGRHGRLSGETLATAASLSVNPSAASLKAQDLAEGDDEDERHNDKADTMREISTELGLRETDSQDEDFLSEGFGEVDDHSSEDEEAVDNRLPRQEVQHAQLEMIACGLCALGMLCFRSPTLGQSRQARMDMEKEVLADLRSLRQWVSRNTVPLGWDPKRLMSRVLTDDMAVPPPPPMAASLSPGETSDIPRRHQSADSPRRRVSIGGSQPISPPEPEDKHRTAPNFTCRGDGAVKTTVPKLLLESRGPRAGSSHQKHPLSARTPRSADLGAGGPQLPSIL